MFTYNFLLFILIFNSPFWAKQVAKLPKKIDMLNIFFEPFYLETKILYTTT